MMSNTFVVQFIQGYFNQFEKSHGVIPEVSPDSPDEMAFGQLRASIPIMESNS